MKRFVIDNLTNLQAEAVRDWFHVSGGRSDLNDFLHELELPEVVTTRVETIEPEFNSLKEIQDQWTGLVVNTDTDEEESSEH